MFMKKSSRFSWKPSSPLRFAQPRFHSIQRSPSRVIDVSRYVQTAPEPVLGPAVIKRVVDPASAPGVTRSDLARLHERLAIDDRAGVCLDLYRLTGQELWLMDAQLTSYSGPWGGGMLLANAAIKRAQRERFTS